MENYLAAISLTKAEFDARKSSLADRSDASLTNQGDVSRIENLLDLKKDILSGQKFYVTKAECECGRSISFYDVIFTAMVEQIHSPSFLAHMLTGSKYFVNKARPVRCSDCGVRIRSEGGHECGYETDQYGCCDIYERG